MVQYILMQQYNCYESPGEPMEIYDTFTDAIKELKIRHLEKSKTFANYKLYVVKMCPTSKTWYGFDRKSSSNNYEYLVQFEWKLERCKMIQDVQNWIEPIFMRCNGSLIVFPVAELPLPMQLKNIICDYYF